MPRSASDFLREVSQIRSAYHHDDHSRRMVLSCMRRHDGPVTRGWIGTSLNCLIDAAERDRAIAGLIASGDVVKCKIRRGGRLLDGYAITGRGDGAAS